VIKPALNYGSKLGLLIPFLKSRTGGAAIVYATTQNDVAELCTSLVASGIDSKPYHAGMAPGERKYVQDWFLAGEGVVVATIAFGMGIGECYRIFEETPADEVRGTDKPNIRQVVHFMVPKTMENYS
jgi:superfamily II DNA helicase RecQ